MILGNSVVSIALFLNNTALKIILENTYLFTSVVLTGHAVLVCAGNMLI